MGDKRCDARTLVKLLPANEGRAGLDEWCTSLRDALVAEASAEDVVKLDVHSLGTISVLPGRGGRVLKFRAARVLKDAAAGEGDELEPSTDPIVTTIVRAVREGYDDIELPGIGTLRVIGVDAFEGMNPKDGTPVAVGARKAIELDFDKTLVAAVTG